MSKKNKKTKGKTKADLAPENFSTKEEHAAAVEEYNTSQPIYNFIQFFIGGPNHADKTKNKQEGKPGAPPYGP